MVNNLTTSDAGLNLIRSEEGAVYHLYNDVAHNCTVGTGHLVHMGPISGAASEAPYKNGCTPEQETALLKHDVYYAEHTVNSHVAASLNQVNLSARACAECRTAAGDRPPEGCFTCIDAAFSRFRHGLGVCCGIKRLPDVPWSTGINPGVAPSRSNLLPDAQPRIAAPTAVGAASRLVVWLFLRS